MSCYLLLYWYARQARRQTDSERGNLAASSVPTSSPGGLGVHAGRGLRPKGESHDLS